MLHVLDVLHTAYVLQEAANKLSLGVTEAYSIQHMKEWTRSLVHYKQPSASTGHVSAEHE